MNRLKYFLQIAEAGSMAKAASILNLSSSALSKCTRLLEDEIGVPLITHSGRNIVITDAGRLLAKNAKRIFSEIERLQDDLQRTNEIKPLVRIATFEVFSTYFLSFLRKTKWDDFALVLHEELPGSLEKAVADGLVDFGISYMPEPNAELDFLKVTTINMGVYINASAFKGVEQQRLPFVVPVEPLYNRSTRVRGLDGWPMDAYKRKIKYEVTLMESALELVRQGRAAGYFPQFIVHEHNERVRDEFKLVRCPSPYGSRTCTTDVYIVKRRSDPEGPILKQMAKGIRHVCGNK